MCGMCLFNIKEYNLDYDKQKKLAGDLIKFALDNNLGVFFNSKDYDYKIMQEQRMDTFFSYQITS